MTLRENAQFIDELRQHYRRLDGLLEEHKDKLGDAIWLFNEPVTGMRILLFQSILDPNKHSPPSPEEIEEKGKLGAPPGASPATYPVSMGEVWIGKVRPTAETLAAAKARPDPRLRLLEVLGHEDE